MSIFDAVWWDWAGWERQLSEYNDERSNRGELGFTYLSCCIACEFWFVFFKIIYLFLFLRGLILWDSFLASEDYPSPSRISHSCRITWETEIPPSQVKTLWPTQTKKMVAHSSFCNRIGTTIQQYQSSLMLSRRILSEHVTQLLEIKFILTKS